MIDKNTCEGLNSLLDWYCFFKTYFMGGIKI